MTPRQQRWLSLALAVLAALSGWWVWQLRDREEPPPLVGPPRSDYQIERFELIAFDDAGNESFSLRGPRLSRHPYLGEIDVEQPRLRMPADGIGGWQGRADRAWISRDGDHVRLQGQVDLRGPLPTGRDPLRLRSEALELFPKTNQVHSDTLVTITGSGSILRGRGLRAELDPRRLELLSEVTGRYELRSF